MAVIDTVPGLEIQILVKNQPVKEYADEESDQSAKTVYIQTEPGTEFKILFKFTKNFDFQNHDAILTASADGECVACKAFIRSQLEGREFDQEISGRKYVESDQRSWKFQKIRFADLSISKDINYPSVDFADL